MNWTHPPGAFEYFLIATFLIFYLLYVVRTFRIAFKFGIKPRQLFLKFFLRTLVFSLLLISLAGPNFGETEKRLIVQGRDIYLAVDVSKSMDAPDVSPTRLEKVKYELNQLTRQLSNNRMGLIAFSNDAYIQSPLTYDMESLQFLIESLDTRLLPGQGTNVCSALQMAFERLNNQATQANTSKIIVVFTDGEAGTDCGNEIFSKLRIHDYIVFYVGVGTRNGSTIPTPDGLLRTETGETVVTRIDEPSILKMAKETSSDYFRIGDDRIDTEELIKAINTAQTHRIDTRSIHIANNKFYYFLGIGLLLLTLDVLITFRTFRV